MIPLRLFTLITWHRVRIASMERRFRSQNGLLRKLKGEEARALRFSSKYFLNGEAAVAVLYRKSLSLCNSLDDCMLTRRR